MVLVVSKLLPREKLNRKVFVFYFHFSPFQKKRKIQKQQTGVTIQQGIFDVLCGFDFHSVNSQALFAKRVSSAL